MATQNIYQTGKPGSKRWTAIERIRGVKGFKPEAICKTIYATGLYNSYNEVVGIYNWAIREGYVEGYSLHALRGREWIGVTGPKALPKMRNAKSMRQTAIDVMSANPDRPMNEVLALIAEANNFSIGKALTFYRWVVKNGRAPGHLLDGWSVVSSPYQKPQTLSEAIKMLRYHLGQPSPNAAAIIQLIEICRISSPLGGLQVQQH
jgi:hypothetical protein